MYLRSYYFYLGLSSHKDPVSFYVCHLGLLYKFHLSLDKLYTSEGINSLWISYLSFFKGRQKIDIEITNKKLNKFFFGSLVFLFLSAFSIFTPSIMLNSIHVHSIVLLVSTTGKITKQKTKEVIIFYQCKSRTTHLGRIQACICKMILEHKNMMNISKIFLTYCLP